MKTFFFAALFATYFAVALCESCSHRGNCTVTKCNTGSIECVDFQGTHACICIDHNQHGIGCTTQSQCIAALNCNNSAHCVDGSCHCEGDALNQGLDIGGQQPGGQHLEHHQQQTGGQHQPNHQQHTDGQQHTSDLHPGDHQHQPGGQYHADHHHHQQHHK